MLKQCVIVVYSSLGMACSLLSWSSSLIVGGEGRAGVIYLRSVQDRKGLILQELTFLSGTRRSEKYVGIALCYA